MFGSEMAELTLEQETALKVRELQVRFDAFETDNRMSDCIMTEIDEELEEGRVNVEKLEKRVRELEKKERVVGLEDHLRKLKDKVQIIGEGDDKRLDLLEEKTAALDAQNTELRDHLNATVDTLNAVVKIINDQIIAREPIEDPNNPDSEDLTHPDVDRHHYLEEVNELTQEEWNDLLQI